MIHIDLWSATMPQALAEDSFRPYLEFYQVHTDNPVGVVVIFPGGGYSHRAEHEGRPVAELFNRNGFHACVVQYRVSPNRYPAALNDAARALRIIRNHATKWNILSDKIAVCGFSAGGHLAASLGLLHQEVDIPEDELGSTVSARPNCMILSYPVISSGKFGHCGSFDNLIGSGHHALREYLSLEKRVTADTPPSFLWHTADDQAVPVENSIMFAKMLSQFKVPFEMHIFPHGRHGLGLAEEQENIAVWSSLAVAWLKNMGFDKPLKQ